jgi:HlyD family secretion protein
MKSLKKKLTIAGAILLLIILTVWGVAWSKRGQVTVQTGTVNRQNLAAVVTASGQIEPKNYANVSANTIGMVTDIYVKEGERVKKGQLLMRTEDTQQVAEMDASAAALNTSKADADAQLSAVHASAAALRTAQANLAQSKAKLDQAKLSYDRGLKLLKLNLLAKMDFDTRLSDYQVAQATLQSSEAAVNQAKAQYQQAKYTYDKSQAAVAQNQANLVSAKDVVDKTIYDSPYNGFVTDLPVHVGEIVVPGVQNTTGSVLFQVSDLSIIDAEVMADETDIINVKLGQPAEVSVDAIPNKIFKGTVTEIGQSALSSTTGQTTTGSTSSTSTSDQEAKQFKVVVRLDNPPASLRPGLSATAKIVTATAKNAVTIPIQALTVRTKKELQEGKDKKKGTSGETLAAENKPPTDGLGISFGEDKDEIQGVFVVRNGRAIFIPVKTGIMGTTNVEVLSGIKQGDTIVTGSYSVLRTLKNNTKVKVDNTIATPNPNADNNS